MSDSEFSIPSAEIFGAMMRHKIEEIVVSYSGSGDSGGIDEIDFRNPLTLSADDDTKLRGLVESYCCKLWERSNHAGWWNDNGAYGTISFNRADRTAAWNHNDYVQETINSCYTYRF